MDWRSPQHTGTPAEHLERYAVPRIGEMPISEVSSADVMGILAPIWQDKAATSWKLRQRMRKVGSGQWISARHPWDRTGGTIGVQGRPRRRIILARWRRLRWHACTHGPQPD